MSDTHALEEAIADGELNYINFFNGRLLSAGDLTQEQTVNRARARHLGQALGTGVAFGLEVAPSASSPPEAGGVEIAAGLAVNAAGQTLRLATKQTIVLIDTPDPSQTAECLFVDCELIPAGTTASTSGFYLLTIAPAAKKDGLASVSGLGNQLAACNSKYYAEGVKFRFVRLQTGASGAQARNTLAYQCFGRPAITVAGTVNAALGQASVPDYGVATLTSGQLTDEDVPLAIVEWKGAAGLGFIDMWSVRRRVMRPAAEGAWEYFVADRRQAEGEAMLMQFQTHIQELQATASAPGALTAESRFTFLPPVGVLPTGAGKFDWRTFLGPLGPEQETSIDLEIWRRVLRESLLLEPISIPSFASIANRVTAPPWPAPVKVYRVPERDEVLVTRGRLARVRVFVTPSSVTSANVKLTVQNTNLALSTTSKTAGRNWYLIEEVPSGTHSLEVTATGFQTLTNISVNAVEGRTIDIGAALASAASTARPPASITTELRAGRVSGADFELPSDLTLRITVLSTPLVTSVNLSTLTETTFLYEDKNLVGWLKQWQSWLSATGNLLGQNPTRQRLFAPSKLQEAMRRVGAAGSFPKVTGYAVFGTVGLKIRFEKA